MRRTVFRLLPVLCLALAACGGTGSRTDAGVAASVECAPFARALTGISLSGAAADWWRQADGRYGRSSQPEVGSLLVFRRSRRLPDGHVAVVSQVLSPRRIMVTQANWVHHRVTQDQPVIDASDGGDWSTVRVWWPPAGQMGVADYPTFGFIRPDRPAGHDRLIAGTPAAIRIAEGSR
ncbi:MAG TPA: CHAP domain-containing protein [Rhodopila sp.]